MKRRTTLDRLTQAAKKGERKTCINNVLTRTRKIMCGWSSMSVNFCVAAFFFDRKYELKLMHSNENEERKATVEMALHKVSSLYPLNYPQKGILWQQRKEWRKRLRERRREISQTHAMFTNYTTLNSQS